MTQLINKGGFRERANRSRKYRESENEVTSLPAHPYQPQSSSSDQAQAPENKSIASSTSKQT